MLMLKNRKYFTRLFIIVEPPLLLTFEMLGFEMLAFSQKKAKAP